MSKSTTALAGFDGHKDSIVIAVAAVGRNGVGWALKAFRASHPRPGLAFSLPDLLL